LLAKKMIVLLFYPQHLRFRLRLFSLFARTSESDSGNRALICFLASALSFVGAAIVWAISDLAARDEALKETAMSKKFWKLPKT